MQNTLMPKGAEQTASGAPHLDLSRIAQDLQIRKVQVESVVQLLDEGNTVPAVNNLQEILPTLLNPEKELNTAEDVLLGVQHILAEQIAETADVRAAVRFILWETGRLCTAKSEKLAENQGLEYKDYFQFTE